MKKKNKKIFIFLAIIAVAIIVILFLVFRAQKPGRYDVFAQCLKKQGAIFYGAFWCPHCQNEKTLFGASIQYLPYVECSTPDGKGQLSICTQNKITGYPTWDFKDGSRLIGETPLDQLASKTDCVLPQ